MGTAWPRTAERMVIAMRAEKAAEKTRRRGCFIAIKAAMRKVLSPISENMIIVRESTKEWSGWIKAAGDGGRRMVGMKGLDIFRGSSLGGVLGTGCGISCGFSGKSAGFCSQGQHIGGSRMDTPIDG